MKNIFIALVLSLFLAGCGDDGATGAQGPAGVNGTNGNVGAQGANGHNTLLNIINAESCANGGSTILAFLDLNDDGQFSSGETISSSATICNGVDGKDGQNGENGANGKDAPVTAFTPVVAISPCGVSSSPQKEVLFGLADGSLLGSFSDTVSGTNTRFAFISDGTYQDTDASHCVFTVSGANTGTRTVAWDTQDNFLAGSQSWSW